jgi:drug/metabolite transporter (DMT)-like permease
MTIGYLFLLLSLVAFGALGILHKVADHPDCRPRIITALLLGWGAVLTAIYTALFDRHGLHMPGKVLAIGATAGVFASIALFVFQACLRYGKISTSWLVGNLCVAVPVAMSIIAYRERVTPGKAVGMLLVLVAILLLWWDKKTDLERATASKAQPEVDEATREATETIPVLGQIDASAALAEDVGSGGGGGGGGGTAVATAPTAVAVTKRSLGAHPATVPHQSARKSLWLPLIMVAFVANGLSASSQKVLVEAGGGDYAWQFYVILYLAGFALFALVSLVRSGRPNRREFATASVMAVASVAGNISIVKALDGHVPGSVAYPVGNGGSLFLVVLAGVLLFKEHINPAGIAGIAVGIGAILVLVMS